MNKNRTERGVWNLLKARGAILFAASVLALLPASSAQTHKVAKPENVVRSVGVYEWTGDMAKPTASRLIPVSLFIEGKLQDAAVYLASPAPFALLSGDVYELQKSGVALGTFDIAFSRHLIAPENATTTYDDGWFGYGKFVPPAAEKKSNLKASTNIAKINAIDEEDDSAPHFSSRSAVPGSGGAATPAPGSASTSTATPSDDPDRPTMHRSAGASDKTADTSTPADDVDRPTLRRRSPEDAKNAKSDRPSVTPVANSLNDDPNRPLLHRGKPIGSMTDVDIPKLSGLPGDQDLHQVIAVSDAADRAPHDFSRPWADEEEHKAILGKMQAAARAQLATYEAANSAARTTPTQPAAPRPANRAHRTAAKPTPAPATATEALMDEKLIGYQLSYGGAATFVYAVHTGGLGSDLRFVTLVAQVNMNGEPEIALRNVTDAAHLDRTPRMKLVDAVDADASNRASLLFELRAQNSRQFALYRVIGARAEQTFVTGSTQ